MASTSFSEWAWAGARAFWAGCCAASACDLAAHLLKEAPLKGFNFHFGGHVSGETSYRTRVGSIALVALAGAAAGAVGGGRQRPLAFALGVAVALETLILAGLSRCPGAEWTADACAAILAAA